MIVKLVIIFAAIIIATRAQGLVCCGAGECALSADCPVADRCGVAECGSTSSLGQLCGCSTPPAACTDPEPDQCHTCVNGAWVEDPAKLDPCGKCASDCKTIAQNLAITSGRLVVNGIDILD